MTISKRIRTARLHSGLTQKELAQKINVSPQVISNWERNYTTPDADDIANLAKVLDVPADYLLLGPQENMILPGWIANEVQESKPSSRDVKDLKKFLEQSEVMFDGVPLDENDKQRIEDVLTGMFWEAKQMNKRKKKTDKDKD